MSSKTIASPKSRRRFVSAKSPQIVADAAQLGHCVILSCDTRDAMKSFELVLIAARNVVLS